MSNRGTFPDKFSYYAFFTVLVMILLLCMIIPYKEWFSEFAQMERQTLERCYPVDRPVRYTIVRDSFDPVMSESEIFGGCYLEHDGHIEELCLLPDGSGLYSYSFPWDTRFETYTRQIMINGMPRTVTERRVKPEPDGICPRREMSLIFLTKEEFDHILRRTTPPE